MERKISSLLIGFFLIMLMFQKGVAEASEPIIVPKQDGVPIYDNRSGEFIEIGQMRIGEPMITLQKDGENWWQVKFGNAYGYVKKDQVELKANVKIPAKNIQPNTKTVVLTEENVDVYDNSTGTLKKFAMLKSGYRYPVLSDFGQWWKIDVGGRVGFIHKASTSIDQGIPVLMYHHILTAKEKANSPFANLNTTISVEEFNEQMDYLKRYDYTTISTKDLEDYLNGQLNLPAKSIVLTIDDGNISSRIHAYPKLREHGFRADQFIITSRTPKTPATFDHRRLHFLSQQEMDKMTDVYNYYGHTHALHALTNSNESYLTAKNRNEVKQDLLLNRKLLNDMAYFAYPFGQYNNATLAVLKETGFTMAYTTKMGRAKLGMNKYLIPRLGIEPNLSIQAFAKKVETGSAILDQPGKPKPAPKPEPEGLFTDVKESDEFYEAILSLTQRDVLSGFSDGSFKPYNGVTRGQAAKILALSLSLEVENVEHPGFTDVSRSNEYYGPIAALVKEGIIQGYPDDTYRPGNQLTRAQMAKMIAIGFQLEQEELIDERFTDVKKEDAFAGYVQALLTYGVTKGTTATTFSPYTNVTRGQLAMFVTRSESSQ